MFQLDTTHIVNTVSALSTDTDSVKTLTPTSSVFKVSGIPIDTSHTDSLIHFDTISPIQVPFQGFQGIQHPSTPANQGWLFFLLLGLFFLLIFFLIRYPTFIKDTVQSFLKSYERGRNMNEEQFNVAPLSMVLFSLGVVSLYAFSFFYKPPETFELQSYGYFLVITAAFFVFKWLTIQLIGFVFFDKSTFKLAKFSYFRLFFLLTIILFPLLTLHVYLPNSSNWSSIVTLFLFIIAFMVLIIKFFQIFSTKFVAFFYIFLYLCTLEILPLILLIKAYQWII